MASAVPLHLAVSDAVVTSRIPSRAGAISTTLDRAAEGVEGERRSRPSAPSAPRSSVVEIAPALLGIRDVTTASLTARRNGTAEAMVSVPVST